MLKKHFLFILFLFGVGKGLHAQTHDLDFYVSNGIKSSPLLKDYGNQILSNHIDSLVIRAGLKPQLNALSQALVAPYGQHFGYDQAISNGGIYSALITGTLPLINKKYINGQFQNMSLLNQSLLVNSKITENDLKKSITAQYLTAYANYSQLQFYQALLQQLKDEQNVLKQLVEKGMYLQTDYLNLSVTIRSQQITIAQTELQYKNALNNLNLLSGIVDTSSITLTDPGLTLRNNFDIGKSVVMMQFRIDSLKNVNNKLLVDLNYRPKLNAYADAGFMAIRPQNIPNNFGGSIGLNFSIPIYDGKQRRLQYDKISLAEHTREGYRDFYTTQYQQQYNQLMQEYKLTQGLITEINTQIGEQKDLLDLYKLEIEKGLVRFSDFIIAVNSYINTRYSLTQTEMSSFQIINELNYLK